MRIAPLRRTDRFPPYSAGQCPAALFVQHSRVAVDEARDALFPYFVVSIIWLLVLVGGLLVLIFT